MQHNWHERGDFTLIATRYKNESKYETKFIDNVVKDFKYQNPIKSLDDAAKHLEFLAKYNKSPTKDFTIVRGSDAKYTSGSIATKHVSIKIKPYGNFIVEIQQSFKPGECLE